MSLFAPFAYQIPYPYSAKLLQRQSKQRRPSMCLFFSLLSAPTLQIKKHSKHRHKQPRLAGDNVARLRKHRLRAAAGNADYRPLAAPAARQ